MRSGERARRRRRTSAWRDAAAGTGRCGSGAGRDERRVLVPRRVVRAVPFRHAGVDGFAQACGLFQRALRISGRGAHRVRQRHLRLAGWRADAALPRDVDRIRWPPAQRACARGGVAGRAPDAASCLDDRWRCFRGIARCRDELQLAPGGGQTRPLRRHQRAGGPGAAESGSVPGPGSALRRTPHSAGPDLRRCRQSDRDRLRRWAHRRALRHRGLHPSRRCRARPRRSPAGRGGRWPGGLHRRDRRRPAGPRPEPGADHFRAGARGAGEAQPARSDA